MSDRPERPTGRLRCGSAVTLLDLPSPRRGDADGPVADTHLGAVVAATLRHGAARLEASAAAGAEGGDPDRAARVGPAAVLLLASARADERHRRLGLSRDVTRLADALVPHARGERRRRRLAASPSRATWLGLPHLVLTATGRPDPEVDRLVQACLAADAAPTGEREPHRLLDDRWVRAFPTGRPVEHADVLAWSVLCRGVDLLTAARSDLRAVGRALCSATDLGRQPLHCARDPHAVAGDVDSALALALDADELGLAAELLVAPLTLRLPWSAAQILAWQVIDRRWAAGRLEGPPPGARDQALDRSWDRLAYAVGLVAAMSLTSAAPPPRTVVTAAADPTAGALVESLRATGRRAYLDHLAGATPSDRAAALPLLLDVSVHRAAVAGDAAGLLRVLDTALARGMSGRPLVTQAGGLLQRLLLPTR